MQSDTPRTDANVLDVDYETIAPDGEPSQVIEEVVRVDFARQLERELAAAIKQRDEARRMYLASTCSDDEIIIEMKRNGWDCFAQKEAGGA